MGTVVLFLEAYLQAGTCWQEPEKPPQSVAFIASDVGSFASSRPSPRSPCLHYWEGIWWWDI